jgi:uridylate kinase
MDDARPYKRILLKMSGEQLAGKFDVGIDPEIGNYLAGEIQQIVDAGVQVAIVVGGGNMVRGSKVAGNGIRRVTADQMGMLSSLINAMALTDIFEANHLKTRCMSNIFAVQVAESYTYRLGEKHLQKGRVVIVAGGMGRPYFTTDTGAVNLALELDCQVVLKATKVDGVYDKDPAQFPDAKRLDHLTIQEAVSNDQIMVMDKAAIGLALEQHMPIIVFDAMKPGNLLKIVKGDAVGTTIS